MPTLVLAGALLLAMNADTSADPYSWLEEITGQRAMAFVETAERQSR